MTNFSERIRMLRNEHNLKQAELAEILGVKYRTYQDYEYGKCYPTAMGLVAVADYFHVSLDYLMGRTDKREVNQ